MAHGYRARLWAPLADFLHEPHFATDLHPAEGSMKNAAALEVDLVPFRRLDEPVPLIAEELADTTAAVMLMRLGVATPPLHVILKHACRVIEGIIDGGKKIPMSRAFIGRSADDELGSGHREADPNTVGPALLVVVVVRSLQGDPATRDVIEKRVELRRSVANVLVDRWRAVQSSKGELNEVGHR